MVAVEARAHFSSRNGRILLVDEGWVQTLPLARALELSGFRVMVATANGSSARLTRRTVEWESGPRVDDVAFIGWLDRAMCAGSRTHASYDLVVPLTERVMLRLWDARVAWADRVFPSTTPWQRRVLGDKHVFVDELAARGVPTLRQQQIRLDREARDDLQHAVRDLGFPLVVKGAVGVGGERVRIVENHLQLDAALSHARAIGGTWCLQEWAPGPTFLVGGVFDAGRPLRLYAGKKLEQFPPRIGPAIRLLSTIDARVRALGQRVMRELAWTGMGSTDLIMRGDGSLAVLEINPRPWGSIASAHSAGVDVYAPFAALLRGEHPAAELTCADGDDCMVFPRYLLAPRYRGLRGVVMAARDLIGTQGAEWRHPRFLLHVLGRLDRLSRGCGL